MCSKASSKLKKFRGDNSTSRFDVLGPTRKTSEAGSRIAITSQLIEDRGSARQDRKLGLIGECPKWPGIKFLHQQEFFALDFDARKLAFSCSWFLQSLCKIDNAAKMFVAGFSDSLPRMTVEGKLLGFALVADLVRHLKASVFAIVFIDS
jgi:hypothetical protein